MIYKVKIIIHCLSANCHWSLITSGGDTEALAALIGLHLFVLQQQAEFDSQPLNAIEWKLQKNQFWKLEKDILGKVSESFWCRTSIFVS